MHAAHTAIPDAPRIDDLRDDLVVHVRQLRITAMHLTTLENHERPHHARRLARTLRAAADRAEGLLADAHRGHDEQQLDRMLGQLDAASLECSRYLVRNGVRNILGPERFAPIDDAALIVGELAKVAFGELLLAACRAQPTSRRQRHEFELNPLHAFTPVIAAGHEWARQSVAADEVDRYQLVSMLAHSTSTWSPNHEDANPFAHPTSIMTADALGSLLPEWMLRCDDELVRDLDRVADRVLPPLDGCGIDPSDLETWVCIGAMSGIARSLQLRCDHHDLRIDTCDATILLPALAASPATRADR